MIGSGAKLNIKEKIMMDCDQLIENGPINIVVFGDSVTHGAFAYGEIDFDAVYWNLLRKKICGVRNYVPVNMINAGIGGITAARSVDRMDSQVFVHNPDLLIICFGLNDVNGSREDWLQALNGIFEKGKKKGVDMIFMTPNMLNTYVAKDTNPIHLEYAAKTAEYQNSGRMDEFIYAGIEVARNMNVKVCDVYSKWKDMSKTQDTTLLLANRINHPTKEMHRLFADSLFEMIFDGKFDCEEKSKDTMYKK